MLGRYSKAISFACLAYKICRPSSVPSVIGDILHAAAVPEFSTPFCKRCLLSLDVSDRIGRECFYWMGLVCRKREAYGQISVNLLKTAVVIPSGSLDLEAD